MKCPQCDASDTAPIIYGMATPELFSDQKAPKLKIGGCDLDEENPVLHCFACGHEWGRMGDAYPEMFRD